MEVLTSILHKVTGSQSPIRLDEHNLTLIGSGSSGPVYLAKDQSGFPIAVKKAHIRELDEVKLLSKLSHKNIVKYLGVETKEETSYILLEYVPGGSISSHLMKRPFNEDKIRTYTQQLLSGLQYLHQKEIKHGDIKGANILIDADGCIKLADFGLSKQGAQLWMAPEVLDKDLHNSRFTYKSDIWSVGCTVIEMATGEDPWRRKYHAGASFLKHMDKSDSVPTIPYNLSSDLKQFLRRCLQREQDLRPSASQLLQDPFITGQNIPQPSTGRVRGGPSTSGGGGHPRPPAPIGGSVRPRPPASSRGGVHPPAASRGGVHPPAASRGGVRPRPPATGRGGVRPHPPDASRGGIHPRSPTARAASRGFQPHPTSTARVGGLGSHLVAARGCCVPPHLPALRRGGLHPHLGAVRGGGVRPHLPAGGLHPHLAAVRGGGVRPN